MHLLCPFLVVVCVSYPWLIKWDNNITMKERKKEIDNEQMYYNDFPLLVPIHSIEILTIFATVQ